MFLPLVVVLSTDRDDLHFVKSQDYHIYENVFISLKKKGRHRGGEPF